MFRNWLGHAYRKTAGEGGAYEYSGGDTEEFNYGNNGATAVSSNSSVAPPAVIASAPPTPAPSTILAPAAPSQPQLQQSISIVDTGVSSKPSLSASTAALSWSVPAILHYSMLIIITSMVAVFYARDNNPKDHRLRSVDTWSLSPIPCWDFGNDCVPALLPAMDPNLRWFSNCSNAEDCHLAGAMPEFERRDGGLFSSVAPPFLVMVSQVISASFALLYVHYDGAISSKVQKWLKRASMLTLIVYGGFFLFMQRTWGIPMNNILIAETALLFSLFYIGILSSSTYAEHEIKKECVPMRFLDLALSVPLLGVAVLCTAGRDSTGDLLQSMYSLAVAYLLCVAWEYEIGFNSKVYNPSRVILFSSWLALLPFCIFAIDTLQSARDAFSKAALGVFVAMVFSQHLFLVDASERRTSVRQSLWQYIVGVEFFSFAIKGVVSLILVVGAISVQ